MNDKKMGRLEVKDPRNNSIIFTCSLADKNKIVKAAESSGLSISSYVLKKIING